MCRLRRLKPTHNIHLAGYANSDRSPESIARSLDVNLTASMKLILGAMDAVMLGALTGIGGGMIRDVLTAQIKAYEIQGGIAIRNSCIIPDRCTSTAAKIRNLRPSASTSCRNRPVSAPYAARESGKRPRTGVSESA